MQSYRDFGMVKAEEAARILGISKHTLYRLTSEKKIPFVKPTGGQLFFRVSVLEDILKNGRSSA